MSARVRVEQLRTLLSGELCVLHAPVNALNRPARAVLLLTFLLSACNSLSEPAPNPGYSELFQLCAQCHGANAMGNPAVNAPAIAGLPQWYIEEQLRKFRSGMRGRHFDDLTGMQMRPMALSLANDDEVVTIAMYVASLPATKPAAQLQGGDATRGRTLFAPCTACHGPEAAGQQALKAPPLNHASDWYLMRSIEKFKLGIRGTAQGDTSGPLMRPMAQTLPDEQAMKDVIAYVGTLAK
jgi:cytochrome c oxidase subunit 2